MSGHSGQSSGRQGVLVVAPTTDEPILLKRLTLSPRIPASRVVLANETADQCEQWTRDYNNLLRADGPARSLLGLPDGGGYRLVVSGDIDHGKSWIMPVMAAHAAQALDLPAVDQLASARALIWTTGALNLALAETMQGAAVVDDDYHLKTKVDRSRALFADAAHARTPVICLLPRSPGDVEAATWLSAILKNQPHHVRIVETMADLHAVIRAFARRGDIADLAAPTPGKDMIVVGPQQATSGETGQAPSPDAGATPERTSRQDDKRQDDKGQADGGQRAVSEDAVREGASRDHGPRTGERWDGPSSDGARSRRSAIVDQQRARFPLGMTALIGVGALAALGAAAYSFIGARPPAVATPPASPVAQQARPAGQTPGATPTAGPAQTAPAQTAPTQTAGQPAAQPATQTQALAQAQATAQAVASTQAAARLVLLRPIGGRSCQSVIFDMQPRFEEVEQLLGPGQPPVEIDRTVVCGLSVTGQNMVSARFGAATRELVVPSLSSGNRLILNPTAAGQSQQLMIELSGAQTGQIVLQLR
jgi:hypothetical protein